MALKTLPYGGIYLIGGVTMGIADYIREKHFFDIFYAKGRLEAAVRRIPVYILNPDVELGILGAEECAFRELGSYHIKL